MFSGGISDVTSVPIKKFTLASLDDSNGIIDPQTGLEVTARGLIFKAAGTIALVDQAGNSTTQVISSAMVDSGEPVKGLYNGVKSTGTVTITASDVIVCL